MDIQQALRASFKKLKPSSTSADLDAEVLLLEALNRCGKNVGKEWLYTHNNYKLSRKESKLFNNFVRQRSTHKPVAYILNRKEFYGYDFYVDKNVLIPRPETELIVEEALKIIKQNKLLEKTDSAAGVRHCRGGYIDLVDIGTGSGCIIISILNELIRNKEDKIVHSTIANDISPKAVRVAKVNAQRYGLARKIKFIAGDLEEAISEECLTSNKLIITANLPYIKNSDYKTLPKNIKDYEPAVALKGGKEGLDHIEKLINKLSKSKLAEEKRIFVILEADPRQMNKIENIFRNSINKVKIKTIKDLNKKRRAIIARIN